MVGLGVAELILLALMAGGSLPQQIAFGNPAIWLAQSVMTRAVPGGAVAGFLLLGAESTTMRGPVAVPVQPPVKIAPPSKQPAQPKP